ncbi:MAG: LUD domain-containing protein [Dermatophilaceae bacterium]
MTGSAALAGTERVTHDAPEWARAEVPAHRRPLPLLTKEAVERPGVGLTRERLSVLGEQRASGVWSPWAADLRERGAAIRRETLGDLEGHLRRLADALERNGCVVHRVSTPRQAREAVARIALDNDVRLVAKSKSMATEEIRLTEHLNGIGIAVVETDLGEYIVQAAGERPSHIVGPALHKSRQDVTTLFGQLAGSPMSSDPDELASFARARLRADFKAADMGICGVNFAAADTGTLAIVTNEGNADMVTSQPDVVVAVMPVEKVIPRFADLGVLVPLLCDTANKQFVTAYQTLLNGPRRPGETDGPSQLHVVIFDNGRTAVLGTPKEEVLACIRCGNCQFACPVFRTLGGGHAYGTVYGGPIGAILSPIIGDPDTDADLPFLSSLCGACADACPVKIPIPQLLLTLRAEYAGRHTTAEALGWRAWGRLWGNPRGYRATVGAAALVGRFVPGRWLARLPGPAGAWARGRVMPPLWRAGAARRLARHRGGAGGRRP